MRAGPPWPVLLLSLALGALGGCAGTRHASAPPTASRAEFEVLDSVLVAEDGSYFVALTDRHDYIFEDPGALARVIGGPLHPYATGEFGRIVVDARGRTTATVALRLRELPPTLVEDARSQGFEADPRGGYLAHFNLHGESYESSGSHSSTTALNRSYRVRIEREAVAAASPSPVRRKSHGGNKLGLFLALPVVVPLILVKGVIDPDAFK